MSDIIDHEALGLSRLITQYRESQNLIEYLKILLSEENTLEGVFRDILDKRWIDTAEGVNLDIIGAIVGQTRELIDAETFIYFGFAGNPASQSFGTVSDPSIGGRFIRIGEVTEGIRLLSDEEYRIFIRAKISANTTTSTPEEVIAQVKFILDVPLIIFADGNTQYTIGIGRKLTLNEKALIKDTNIIPKTASVAVNFSSEFETDNFFGFKGIPGARGFGSIGDLSSGGILSNLIFK